MGINAGGRGDSFRRNKGRHRRIEPGQAKKPFQPVHNPFEGEKEEFSFGLYKVVEEFDDYLKCRGFDPQAKFPFSEFTPNAKATVKIAKPPLLQKMPWDGKTVTINEVEYTYEYEEGEMGLRTATWEEDGTEHKEKQHIEPPYFENDIIVAVEVSKSQLQSGMTVNEEKVEDENGAPLGWVDLNVSGRVWGSPKLLYAVGKTSAGATAGSTVSVALYKNIRSTPETTGDSRTCHAFVDIDSGKYVSVWHYDDGYYCAPLECND